ncbi:MAG: thiamine biosynthesis protein ThiF [Streptosporangiaceae bacterium]|nr:thiamine biosynthesis protein ThiF [Streptosporangiaceae bacterium]
MRVSLSLDGIAPVPGGLAIDAVEDVVVVIHDGFPDRPPLVLVEHDRFIGFPNVLLGQELCIYLDVNREWHPGFGMREVLERLWSWFDDAANARYDARTDLFHAIGGRQPTNVGSPTVVVRASPPNDHKRLSLATLRDRGPHRIDLVGWRLGRAERPDHSALVFSVPTPLYRGLAAQLGPLLQQLAGADGPPIPGAITALHGAAVAAGAGQPVYFLVAVRHPADQDLQHLVPGRLPAVVADVLRSNPGAEALGTAPLEWLPMSDERQEVVTRRDEARPVTAFRGTTIELWGCGGIGSWTGEFAARAGTRRLTLRDIATVTGGLLVRQNFTEDDVGRLKAAGLAARLRAITDDLDVVAAPGNAVDMIREKGLPDVDVIVDATVNETVAAHLDEAARRNPAKASLAQIATDTRTASLGLLVFVPPETGVGPATVDRWVSEQVLANGELERYHCFWTPADKADQLVPAAGCTVPTFHGSAADLAVVAGGLFSLLGQSLKSGTPGVHLLASAHAGGVGPTHVFIPYTP